MKFPASHQNVLHRLADRTGANACVMPVPFVDETVHDRIVAVAGDAGKSADITPVLPGRHLSGLNTDEHTARMLI